MGLEHSSIYGQGTKISYVMAKKKRKKIAKNTEANSVINQQDTINMHVTFPLMPAEHTLSVCTYRTYTKTEHTMGHKQTSVTAKELKS